MKTVQFLSMTFVLAVLMISCDKQEENLSNQEQEEVVPKDILAKLEAADFDISSARLMEFMGEHGVGVEDMFFTFQQIDELSEDVGSDDGTNKHYRTRNLVTGLPRLIRVSVDPDLGSLGSGALDETIDAYNALDLRLSFERVVFGEPVDIEVTEFFELEAGGFITLGRAAGFPTDGGDPARGFGINSRWFDLLNPSLEEVAGTMAHEIGHCIGFRHTDFATRESCGTINPEGDFGVGAIFIDGTPRGSDASSWMQSCGAADVFNQNDINALNTLY